MKKIKNSLVSLLKSGIADFHDLNMHIPEPVLLDREQQSLEKTVTTSQKDIQTQI